MANELYKKASVLSMALLSMLAELDQHGSSVYTAEGYDAAEKSLRSAMETVDALCDQLIPPSEGA